MHTHTTLTPPFPQLSRLQNDLLVKRKALPEKTKLEAELTVAQVEVYERREMDRRGECVCERGG